MEIIADPGAPSTEVDETNAKGNAVAAQSKDQEPDFKVIDSLHRAATHGEINNEELQKHGKHLDQILTPSGNTVLHIYIISRSRRPKTDQFVSNVLKMCPNLLLKANEKGETPLHFAARYGHDDIVEELMQECKKHDYKDQENGVEPKRLMLEKTNEAKDTALHEAVRYSHTDVVNKLIEADTKVPYAANVSGETPLYLAAERGNEDVVRKILDKCKSHAPVDHGPMGRTALHAAVIRRENDMAELLLKEKEYLSRKKDELGRFALHYAALLGYDEIVDKLLREYPSAAYKADNDGNTALHLAAGNGKAKAVNKLIEMCPNCCELVDNRGRNALHLALTSADDSTIEIFLRKPALADLINQKDKDGDTPLLQLANSGSYIRTFISHDKVDKLVFSKENKNAADIILENDFLWGPDMLRKLKMIKEKRCRRIINPKPKPSIREVNYVKLKDERSEDIKKPKEERSKYIMKEKGDGSDDTQKKKDDGSVNITERIKGAEQNYLVAATVIATVTFAAGITMPGGYIGEDKPNEGTALLVSTRNNAFLGFVIFDCIAFLLSCASLFIHLIMMLQNDKMKFFNQFKLELWFILYAMYSMVLAFVTGLYAVTYPNKSLATTACAYAAACLFCGVYYSRRTDEIDEIIEKLKGVINLKKKKKVVFYLD